nr:pyridoxal phosphate homeostasis protein-like isoform X1 [Ipomoea batatas]
MPPCRWRESGGGREDEPVSLIRQVYDDGHNCFCEKYVQEIIQKGPERIEDIEWHFAGHLQSNKVKSLLSLDDFTAWMPRKPSLQLGGGVGIRIKEYMKCSCWADMEWNNA